MATSTKQALANRLAPGARRIFLDRCTAIEKELTAACGSAGDPCLESGCSLEGEDEPCLQPILRAGDEYAAACDAAFAELYADPRNRHAG